MSPSKMKAKWSKNCTLNKSQRPISASCMQTLILSEKCSKIEVIPHLQLQWLQCLTTRQMKGERHYCKPVTSLASKQSWSVRVGLQFKFMTLSWSKSLSLTKREQLPLQTLVTPSLLSLLPSIRDKLTKIHCMQKLLSKNQTKTQEVAIQTTN